MYKPSWAEHEKDLHSDNPDTQIKSAIAFDEERKKETANSKVARKWEEDRKKEWAKNKPEWVKRRIASEQEKITEGLKSLKTLGNFKTIKPASGYILVSVDQEDETTTSNGIILTSNKREPNTGVVLEVGNYITTPKGKTIRPDVSIGDHILFKLGAGAYATLEGTDARLMQFSDVLAVIEK